MVRSLVLGPDLRPEIPGPVILEGLDEGDGLRARELSRRLALAETHRAAGVAEVAVTGIVQEGQELPDLPGRRRRT